MNARTRGLSALLLGSSLCFAGCTGTDDTNDGNNNNNSNNNGTTTQTSKLKGSKLVPASIANLTVESPFPVKVKGVKSATQVSYEIKGNFATIAAAVLGEVAPTWSGEGGDTDMELSITAPDALMALGTLEVTVPDQLVSTIKGLAVDVEGMTRHLTIEAKNGNVNVLDAKGNVKVNIAGAGNAVVKTSEVVHVEVQIDGDGNAEVDAPKASKIWTVVENGAIKVKTDAPKLSETTLQVRTAGSVSLSLPASPSVKFDIDGKAIVSTHPDITIAPSELTDFDKKIGTGEAEITIEGGSVASVNIAKHD